MRSLGMPSSPTPSSPVHVDPLEQTLSLSVSAKPSSGEMLTLQNALDLAGKENAKLRQVIQNLHTEVGLLKERLGMDDHGGLDDIVTPAHDPEDPTSPTPAERAWKRYDFFFFFCKIPPLRFNVI